MTSHQQGCATAFPHVDRLAQNAALAADLLKALAHQSRLMILCILLDGEKSVGELEDILELRQPTVSQQLARLRADGLVSTRRDGKTVYYRVASENARAIVDKLCDLYCDDRASLTGR